MTAVKAKCKICKENEQKNPLNTIPSLFTEIFSRTSAIHPGIFLGRHYGLMVWMNTIASRDQFKPIRIGENLVVIAIMLGILSIVAACIVVIV